MPICIWPATLPSGRVTAGSNMAPWPQYEFMLPSLAPASMAMTWPSPMLVPGDSGWTW